MMKILFCFLRMSQDFTFTSLMLMKQLGWTAQHFKKKREIQMTQDFPNVSNEGSPFCPRSCCDAAARAVGGDLDFLTFLTDVAAFVSPPHRPLWPSAVTADVPRSSTQTDLFLLSIPLFFVCVNVGEAEPDQMIGCRASGLCLWTLPLPLASALSCCADSSQSDSAFWGGEQTPPMFFGRTPFSVQTCCCALTARLANKASTPFAPTTLSLQTDAFVPPTC